MGCCTGDAVFFRWRREEEEEVEVKSSDGDRRGELDI